MACPQGRPMKLAQLIGFLSALALAPVGAQAPNPAAPGPRAALPRMTSPLYTAPGEPAGHFERIVVHGRSLVGNLEGDSPDRKVSVYLPPSYASSPDRRYPVLYLLHGFTDSDDLWFGLKGQHFVNVQ